MAPPQLDKFSKLVSGYKSLMVDIMRRYEVITSIVYENNFAGYNITKYEIVALNFRKIAELIIFANLVGHEEEYAALYHSYKYDWRLSQIISRIKKINPAYYPRPFTTKEKIIQGELGIETIGIPEGTWLTEDELLEMYNACGNLIHIQNPFQSTVELDGYDEKFKSWAAKIVMLLSQHIVALVDGRNQLFCMLNPANRHYTENEYSPSIHIIERVDDELV